MSICTSLLVSADSDTIRRFRTELHQLSISSEVCGEVEPALHLLNCRKVDAVVIDSRVGLDPRILLDAVRNSTSNSKAVTFLIASHDSQLLTPVRDKASFVLDNSLSMHSIQRTLRLAYGMILRERRRYFRCPVSVPVVIVRYDESVVHGPSVNISEGGMALSIHAPIRIGEEVCLRFSLPRKKSDFVIGATICWLKTGHVGVRFLSLSTEQKSELQQWLSERLEESLPDYVAERFKTAAPSEYQ